MVKDISGLTPKPNHELRSSSSNGGKAPELKQPESSAAQNASAANTDQVELSKEATTLKNIENALEQQPEVNQNKVDEIKAALESGTYQIDDLVVAERLLEIDSLFG